MRNLTLFPSMGNANFKHLEDIGSQKLPSAFIEFMRFNAGHSHYERYFNSDDLTWEVHGYNGYIDMYKLLEEFISANWGRMLPFAFDSGGWHYCLCMEDKDYGTIYVNRWTDHSPEEQFIKIADSFEEFINGLMTEEEAEAKGLL